MGKSKKMLPFCFLHLVGVCLFSHFERLSIRYDHRYVRNLNICGKKNFHFHEDSLVTFKRHLDGGQISDEIHIPITSVVSFRSGWIFNVITLKVGCRNPASPFSFVLVPGWCASLVANNYGNVVFSVSQQDIGPLSTDFQQHTPPTIHIHKRRVAPGAPLLTAESVPTATNASSFEAKWLNYQFLPINTLCAQVQDRESSVP